MTARFTAILSFISSALLVGPCYAQLIDLPIKPNPEPKIETDACKAAFNRASKLFAGGDSVQAAEVLRNIRGKCRNPQLLLLLSNILVRLLDQKGAEGAAQEAVKLDPQSAAAHLQYGLVLMSLKNNLSAAEEFEKVTKIDPSNWEAWMSLADLYKRLHQDEKAEQSSLKAAHLAEPDSFARVNTTSNLIRQGKLHEADKQLKHLISDNTGNPEMSKQLALEAVNSGYWEEALAASENVLRYLPDSEVTLRAKATAQYFKNDFQGSIKTCADILRLNSDNLDAKALTALAFFDLGQGEQAEELLDTSDTNKLTSPLSLLALAKWHQYRGDLRAAQESIGAINDGSIASISRLYLARLYEKQGKWDEATEEATLDATSPNIAARSLAMRSEILA